MGRVFRLGDASGPEVSVVGVAADVRFRDLTTDVAAPGNREIAIRMALGATAEGVLGLVVGNGLALVMAGLALGLAGFLALGRALSSQLYAVGPADPATLGTGSLGVALAALVAIWLPARRAARVDPQSALRTE
jgi:putative ABC transport system permease protein